MSDANKPDFKACAKQYLLNRRKPFPGAEGEIPELAQLLDEMYERGHSDGRDEALPGPPPVVQTVFDTVTDLVSNFLYYDRKEDDELPAGAIQDAIRDGHIAIDDIVEHFREKLVEGTEEGLAEAD